MKKILCLLFCLIFAFTATGCNLFKSDQEIFDELTVKFDQDAEAATTTEECKEIGEKYVKSVPKDFRIQAQGRVNSKLFLFDARKYKGIKFPEGSSTVEEQIGQLGHYSK